MTGATSTSIRHNPRLGIILMILVTMIFAVQDGISRYVAEQTNPITVVTIRYWFFALFVLALCKIRNGSIRAVAQTRQPILQIGRGVILVTQIVTAVFAFVSVGIIGFHTLFAIYPLMIAAMSVPFLGERVSWRRWTAIAAGFCGVLIILNPTTMSLDMATLVPLFSALLFAVYGVLTRYASRQDSAETSFFWTGFAGAIAISFVAPFFWLPPQGTAWIWMAALCLTGVTGHFLLIKSLEVAEAATVQPFTYFQLMFSTLVGIMAFDDMLSIRIVIGSAIIVAAGLFTLYRERKAKEAAVT